MVTDKDFHPKQGYCEVWDGQIVKDSPYTRSHKLSDADRWFHHMQDCERCQQLFKEALKKA